MYEGSSKKFYIYVHRREILCHCASGMHASLVQLQELSKQYYYGFLQIFFQASHYNHAWYMHASGQSPERNPDHVPKELKSLLGLRLMWRFKVSPPPVGASIGQTRIETRESINFRVYNKVTLVPVRRFSPAGAPRSGLTGLSRKPCMSVLCECRTLRSHVSQPISLGYCSLI